MVPAKCRQGGKWRSMLIARPFVHTDMLVEWLSGPSRSRAPLGACFCARVLQVWTLPQKQNEVVRESTDHLQSKMAPRTSIREHGPRATIISDDTLCQLSRKGTARNDTVSHWRGEPRSACSDGGTMQR